MNKHLLEKIQIVSGFVPVNLAAGDNAGDWVSLKNYNRCAIVFFGAAGVAAQDPTITLQQGKTVAGGSAKPLATITRADIKTGTLTAVGTFTKVTQAAAATFTDGTGGEDQNIWVIDIDANDLDIDNGFDCIQASIADTGSTSKLGAMLYLLHDPREATDPLPSAIVD